MTQQRCPLLPFVTTLPPQVIDYQKSNAAKDDGSAEIVHAFTACGGNPDKSGFVKCDRVVHVVKEIFKLSFDIKVLSDDFPAAT